MRGGLVVEVEADVADVVVEVDVHVDVVVAVVVDVIMDVVAGVNGSRLWSGRLCESGVFGGLAAGFWDVLCRLAAG